MAKFDLKGLLNDRSVPDRQQDQKIVYRNPKDLIPSEENFYNTEKLERLKQSIKLLGILQPLLIENRDGKDYVIAGHCRRKCCIDLLNEGNDRFSRVPCIYKTQSELEQDACQENDIVRQIMIIQANCYRDKSDWEKMTETLKMEGLVKELREKSPMEGKTRDILKDLIGTSGGQLGRYHAISTNLCEQLMSEFKEDRIKISVAYEASKLNKEYQKQACELYEEAGVLTLDDIRDLYRQQEADNWNEHRILNEHHIFGGPNRKNSEEYGLKVYLCHDHHIYGPEAVHNNARIRHELQRTAQKLFEKQHSHKEFMEIFGRNYLDPVEIGENSEKENEPV